MMNLKQHFLVLLGLFCSFVPSTQAAQPVVSARPVLFVHGFTPAGTGIGCAFDWDTMAYALAANGFTGDMVKIGYYSTDIDCDVNVVHNGSMFTSIEEIAQGFAWYVYNTYSVNGIAVDSVVHSMGGLVVRYALDRVAAQDKAFPPFLSVSHVVSMGTPYTGYALLAQTCHLIPTSVQCVEMAPNSSFIKDLNKDEILLPQGRGGTTWTNIGSGADIFDHSDGVVSAHSATSMGIPAARKMVMPWYKFVFHTMYTRNAIVINYVTSALSDRLSAVTNAMTFVSKPSKALLATKVDAQVSGVQVFSADLQPESDANGPAHIEPFMNGDVQEGVQFSSIAAGGIFDQMGLKNGDVVRGCTAATINQAFANLDVIQQNGGGTIKLCITRDGVNFTKTVAIR